MRVGEVSAIRGSWERKIRGYEGKGNSRRMGNEWK